MGTPRMMIVLLGAAALVVGATAALALGTWWILVAVLAVHAVASSFVIAYTWKRAGQAGDNPDPLTEARIEEERAEGEQPSGPRDREVFT
jgi:membrane protein implicated in regulation of membrane protease activity